MIEMQTLQAIHFQGVFPFSQDGNQRYLELWGNALKQSLVNPELASIHASFREPVEDCISWAKAGPNGRNFTEKDENAIRAGQFDVAHQEDSFTVLTGKHRQAEQQKHPEG